MKTVPQDNLWKDYNSYTSELKEKLIVSYLPLVRYVVDRLAVSFLPQISREDLISSGVIGLLKAVESFDPSKGVKFKTYAIPRIKGAIMDELRRLDWIPRSLRKKAGILDETYSRLEKKLGRTPTDRELSEELNISEEDLHKLYIQMGSFSCMSLDEQLDKQEKSLLEKVPSPYAEDPIHTLERKEIERIMKKILEDLPERERTIMILYYYEELTLKEIGSVLGISESRVSQIHSKVILKLRSKLRKIRNEVST